MGLAVYEPAGYSRLTQVSPGAISTRILLTGEQGREFIVERTADFNTWTGIRTNIAWEGVLEATDPTPTGSIPAYYRAKTGNSP